MKLQKQTSRKIGNKEYSKYVIIIPSEAIKELKWKEGEEIKSKIDLKKLVIESKEE